MLGAGVPATSTVVALAMGVASGGEELGFSASSAECERAIAGGSGSPVSTLAGTEGVVCSSPSRVGARS